MIEDFQDDPRRFEPAQEEPGFSVPPPVWREAAPSSRVPNFGHAVLFAGFLFLALLLAQLVLLNPIAHATASALQPKRQLAAMAIAYGATLGFCFLVFPLFWRRSFPAGVQWNGTEALRLLPKLIMLGFIAGVSVQAISSLIPMPKSIPMDDFFRSASDVWIVTAFGTLLAPLLEELAFRGFLLPAFTIAFDWLGPVVRYVARFSMDRLRDEPPPQHVAIFPEDAWAGTIEGTDNLTFRSRAALVAASLVTSFFFALLHADQLAHALPALTVLFCVSLLLTAVRVWTRSVACSTLVHACYNLSVFVTLFIGTGGYRHLDRMMK
jgi:hypothetical protein